MKQWTVKDAKEISVVGNGNSKMPGSTFSTDAFSCKVGSKLAKIEGSVCNKCYARRIQTFRKNVDKSWKDNYLKATTMIATNPEKWSDAVAFQIKRIATKTGEYYHRWFDSGDLDSVDMLRAIVRACKKTPDIQHWLPTREARIVKEYRKQYGQEPTNLIIRVSATMVGDKPIKGHTLTSTVHLKGQQSYGHVCPAPTQNNNCGSCRACWSDNVANISYTKH